MLPVLLILGGLLSLGGIEPSISDYYHTILRDLFVGIMFAIAIFLICYTGHRRGEGETVSDDWVTTVAGVAALGVAIFPNEGRVPNDTLASVTQALLGQHSAALAHYSSAVIFLGAVGYLAFFRFARTAKPVRRRIYRACGVVIWGATLLVIIASWFKIKGPAAPQAMVNDWLLVLWFEAIGIWAFSIAWLVKGQVDRSLLGIVMGTKRLSPESQDNADA
jgi:O-antigen/teichoic acid export membrane protein